MLPLVSGINSRLPSVNHALISPLLHQSVLSVALPPPPVPLTHHFHHPLPLHSSTPGSALVKNNWAHWVQARLIFLQSSHNHPTCYSNHITWISIQTTGLAFGGTGLCTYRVRGVDGSCAEHLTVESYTVFICQQSYLLLGLRGTPSPTHFHSRLKTFLFCKSFPPQPFLFLLQDWLHGFPRLFTVISELHFHHPLPLHSFTPGLKLSLSANPFHRRLPVLLPDWLHGFPRLFTDTSKHIRLYFLAFLFSTFSCSFRSAG